MHICISKLSPYLNQCWNIVDVSIFFPVNRLVNDGLQICTKFLWDLPFNNVLALSPTYPSCAMTFMHSGKSLAIKPWSWKSCLIRGLKPAVAGRVLRASWLGKMDPTAATEPDASSSKQTVRWPGLPSWVRSCVATRSSTPTPVLKKHEHAVPTTR